VWGIGGIVIGAVAIAVLFAIVANGLSHLGDVPQRKHLKPIPIAASACPYVIVMHEAANKFQIALPLGPGAFDAHINLLSWPQTRTRFDTALRTLELSILVSRPHFPTRIQQQLTVTLGAVRNGEV
jgi:hypothetical protein